LQLFSKTWIGNANLLLSRGKILQPLCLKTLIPILQQEMVDLCLITGDLSTTSQPKEFLKAQEFVKNLLQSGIDVLTLPGNHDHYTRKAFQKKLFYHYLANPAFGSKDPKYDLRYDLLEVYRFTDITLILLDQTLPTPWFQDHGSIAPTLLMNLQKVLNQMAKDQPLICAGHFPLIRENGALDTCLKRGSQLYSLLRSHSKVYYLHGHRHHYKIIQDPSSGLTQIDSGSISDIKKGSLHFFDTSRLSSTPYFRNPKSLSHSKEAL